MDVFSVRARGAAEVQCGCWSRCLLLLLGAQARIFSVNVVFVRAWGRLFKSYVVSVPV